MKLNKRCLSAFSKKNPYIALGTKSKLFDTSFSLTSELSLYDYSRDIHFPTLQTDSKFCKLVWCEKDTKSILATGHDNGILSLYEPSVDPDAKTSFNILKSCKALEGDVLGVDFNASKNVLAAGSKNGNIIFWNLDKIDQQYKSDITIDANITSLSWNKKVSRILCAGTDNGKILVLDIRAKNIAMIIENNDISMINNVSWHPSCPTSIFASTNLNCLHSFNLSADSMITIGSHDSSLLNFEILNDNTIASFSKNKIDYVDVNTNTIKEQVDINSVFDISFSVKDPINSYSFTNGSTEVLPRRTTEILSSNSQILLDNFIVSNSIHKVEHRKLEIEKKEDLFQEVLRVLYSDGKYDLNKESRYKIAELLLADEKTNNKINMIERNCENFIYLDVNDDIIYDLILKNYSELQKKLKEKNMSVSLSSALNILISEDDFLENDDPLIYLLWLNVKKNYESLQNKINIQQWKVIVAILLLSDLDNDEIKKRFNEFIESLESTKDKMLMYILVNNSKGYIKDVHKDLNVPNKIGDIGNFFKSYYEVIKNAKYLDVCLDDPISFEFFWYAKDNGMYDLVKDVKFSDEEINAYISKKFGNDKNISFGGSGISQKVSIGMKNENMTSQSFASSRISRDLESRVSNNKPPCNEFQSNLNTSKNVIRPQPPAANIQQPNIQDNSFKFSKKNEVKLPMYTGSLNKSIINLTIKPPPIPNRSSSQQQTQIPKEHLQNVSESVNQAKPSSFITKPQPKNVPLYKSSVNSSSSSLGRTHPQPRTFTSFNNPSRQFGSFEGSSSSSHIKKPINTHLSPPSQTYGKISQPQSPSTTYSQINASNHQSTQGVKNSIPKPGTSYVSPNQNSSLNVAQESSYDVPKLCDDFEAAFEKLKAEASKKNNLIIGNKIKDAVRRFSVFKQQPQKDLSPEVLEKMNQIVGCINTIEDSSILKQNIKNIVSESIDIKSNHCDIWMSSISILVQLVH